MPHVDKPARGFLRAIAAWLGAVGRSAADRDALARMSDRELCDIGLGCLGTRGAADRPFVATLPY
jgi:uncharacterized protein YjiS (DUF1127 family)